MPETTVGVRRLEGRVAVVTGGASGIGLATVDRFLSEGASVVIGDMNAENGRLVIERITEAGCAERVRFLPVDVSEEKDVEALMALATSDFGRLDIVFNNAGIAGAIGPIIETEVEHWDYTFQVMCRGVFLGIKHGARAMIKGGWGGSIINTASIAALSGCGGPLAYSATKAAVVNITMNAACELAADNIRVNSVCPGIIYTPLMHRGMEAETDDVIEKIQPLPMRGDPAHIAAAVAYFASDDSAFVTGQAHAVDGGYLANGLLGVHPLPGSASPDKPRYTGITYGGTGIQPEVRSLKGKESRGGNSE